LSWVRLPSPAHPKLRRKYRTPGFRRVRYETKVLEHLLLSQAIEHFLGAKLAENISPRTYEVYSGDLRRFTGYLGNDRLRLIDVTPDHIRQFQAYINRTRKSSDTHHQYHRVMRTFFNWCVDEGFLPVSPMIHIKAPKKSKGIIVPFTSDDIEIMLAQCPSRTFLDLRNQAFILFMLDTGCRVSELTGITSDSIDLKLGTVTVIGKGQKARTVGFGNRTRQALWRYLLIREVKASPEEKHLWLSEEMRPITASGLKQIIKRIRKGARLTGKRYSCHTFRHTFAMTLLRSGVNIKDLQTLGGWESLKSLEPYIRMLSEEEALKAHRRHSPADTMFSK